MTINYTKNKNYYRLISLFCLCYTLGTQGVSAMDQEVEETKTGTLTYNATNDNSDTPYKITGLAKVSSIYQADNISILQGQIAKPSPNSDGDAGDNPGDNKNPGDNNGNNGHVSNLVSVSSSPPPNQSSLPSYIFIVHGDLPSSDEPEKQIEVTGYLAGEIHPGDDQQQQQDGHLAAFSKSWLWGTAFIFSQGDLVFYYRKGWIGTPAFCLISSQTDYGFYIEKGTNKGSKHIRIWEKDEKGGIITWQVNEDNTAKIGDSDNQNSVNLYVARLLFLNQEAREGWNRIPYVKLNYSVILWLLTVVLGYVYRNVIYKKGAPLLHNYIITPFREHVLGRK